MPEEKKGDTQGGTDPKKTETAQSQAFDISKIGDEDFEKIFDDPRVWKHSRFKSLNERAKLAEKLEAERQAEENKKLEAEKKFKELAEKHKAEAEDWKKKYNQSLIDNRISAEAAKIGVVDLEAVTKLIDRTKIKVSDDGSAEGIAEAVKTLIDSKPYLKGSGTNTTIGSATNPGTQTGNPKYKFKHSQLKDPAFWREHEKEISEALRTGQVEQDLKVPIGSLG